MPEPVSPDIPKVPQATSEPQQQAPVVEKIPWWKKPFVRNKTPEPPQQDQSFNLEKVISRTTDGKVVVDKPELDKMIASVWKGPHEGEARFMESLRSNINTDASSPELKPINMGGFYTPSEQAAITSPGQAGKLYHEVIAAGENRQNVLPQHPDDQLVLDSQGQPVTEYIAQNDPRYTDPAIPDYLKVGTPDYVIRQAKGGNYLGNPDELNRALATKRSTLAANTFDSLMQAQQNAETVANPIPEEGSVGFDQWRKLINTDLYKIKPKESDNTAQQKQSAWDARRHDIDQITDRFGKGIDEGIKETVVAFQMNGINTTNSCEGHADRVEAAPFIGIGAPHRPTDRFNQETEIFQNIAAAHYMSVMDMRKSETPEARQAYFDANTQTYAAGETEAFTQWREATEQLGRKTEGLLAEFYRDRSAVPEIKLNMEQLDDGMWILTSGNEESLGDKTFLQQRQAEMRAFTDFLKTKYFSQP